MGHDKNEELREEHTQQEEHRQELRDEASEAGDAVADEGSQDRRRQDGVSDLA